MFKYIVFTLSCLITYNNDYSKFNQPLFVNDISSVDWTTILPQRKDVDDIFEAFYSKLNSFVNVHAPLRQLSNREVKLNFMLNLGLLKA